VDFGSSFSSQTGIFPSNYVPTVFETDVKHIAIDGEQIELTLWDTAGQESYEKLREDARTKNS
jgi:small GTP-binding protein